MPHLPNPDFDPQAFAYFRAIRRVLRYEMDLSDTRPVVLVDDALALAAKAGDDLGLKTRSLSSYLSLLLNLKFLELRFGLSRHLMESGGTISLRSLTPRRLAYLFAALNLQVDFLEMQHGLFLAEADREALNDVTDRLEHALSAEEVQLDTEWSPWVLPPENYIEVTHSDDLLRGPHYEYSYTDEAVHQPLPLMDRMSHLWRRVTGQTGSAAS